MTDAILTFENLHKSFKDNAVLKGVNACTNIGDVIGLITSKRLRFCWAAANGKNRVLGKMLIPEGQMPPFSQKLPV